MFKTGEVLRQGSSFNYSEDRFGAWQDEPDVRLHGYWYWDWDDQHLKVTKIDVGARRSSRSRRWSTAFARASGTTP